MTARRIVESPGAGPASRARAHVELPAAWGERRVLEGELLKLGYAVRVVGAGDVWRA